MISSFSHVLFTALCILLVLGSRDAEARPTKRAGALLTLPLTRIPDDPNVHPEVVSPTHIVTCFWNLMLTGYLTAASTALES